jgi:hypothetical protein
VIGFASTNLNGARWVDSAVRYKVWRSNRDKELHLLCGEGAGAFNALPTLVRNLGPWTGSKEGDIERLRLPYRTLLAEHGFLILHCHVSNLDLRASLACGPCRMSPTSNAMAARAPAAFPFTGACARRTASGAAAKVGLGRRKAGRRRQRHPHRGKARAPRNARCDGSALHGFHSR